LTLHFLDMQGGEKSLCTHAMHIQNQFNFVQYNMQYSVHWQFGNSFLILLPLPGNLVVLSVWWHKQLFCWGRVDLLSHHYSCTPQMLWHMSQKSWRCIHLCFQHQGTCVDPLDMLPRSALVIQINYDKSYLLIAWCLVTSPPLCMLVEFCLFQAVRLLVYKMNMIIINPLRMKHSFI
jgi:hypothetical protein